MNEEGAKELRALGDAIRRARKSREISQEDFAELAGVHRTYIGQLERGEKNVSFVSVLKVAKALRQKPSDLIRAAGL